jgi:hypothetical protein
MGLHYSYDAAHKPLPNPSSRDGPLKKKKQLSKQLSSADAQQIALGFSSPLAAETTRTEAGRRGEREKE